MEHLGSSTACLLFLPVILAIRLADDVVALADAFLGWRAPVARQPLLKGVEDLT